MSKKLLVAGVIMTLVAAVLVGVGSVSAQSVTCANIDVMLTTFGITGAQATQVKTAMGCGVATAGAYNFTRDLTVGSTGADVSALQAAVGVTPTTGYFGPITKAAVQVYQTSKGITATGYVGPLTRAALNAAVVVVPTTPGTTPTTPAGLTGDAGSIGTYTLISSYNNEEVGEDAEDVKVYGLEMEADEGSDIELLAVKLVFNEVSADQDFDKYAEEVSVMLGDDEVARIDADEFTDETGTANDWTKTVSLKRGAIIEASEKGKLYVAVSGVNNIDSSDAGETWTLDITNVRYKDAQGTVVSEDPGTATRTFSFNTFASAQELAMKTNLSSNNPSEGIVVVNDEGDDILLMKFKIKAEGSDITLKEIPVVVTSAVANVGDIADSLVLSWTGGDASEDLDDADTSETVTFDELSDLVIEDGDTLEFTLTANSATSSVTDVAGVTLQAAITPVDIVARDESGELIANGDAPGSATGETQHIFTIAPEISVVDTEIEAIDNGTAPAESAKATISVKVTARGGTIYLNGASESTAAKEFFNVAVYGSGNTAASTTASTTIMSVTAGTNDVTNPDANEEYLTLDEDESVTIKYEVTLSQAITTSTAIQAGVKADAFRYGTAATSDTTRSAISITWSDLLDLTKSGTVSLVNAS